MPRYQLLYQSAFTSQGSQIWGLGFRVRVRFFGFFIRVRVTTQKWSYFVKVMQFSAKLQILAKFFSRGTNT